MKKNGFNNVAFEEIVSFISGNGRLRSIKPVFKTDDFALYNEDSLEVMSRFPDNYVDMIFADRLICFQMTDLLVKTEEW